ncbi:5-methyltetrahydropteroyltriglutamate--homocysteine methyltransferase [Amycolatopsis sp. AA4]|uniref:cobalamin-independent methionine synthase II family protein n=1 Tax=Actinomycetes TaxID=1760 RepID=UPI0001DEE3E3|nr:MULTISPECIES: cobalamin-independent methionine synthase II family protein [Actinomycetes]ATY16413.1 5-methyltetrahydropteroyltriglutamate--homocysteine methyltransferase [Amycolatopsis sp. AA4]EFL07623.1 methionine synthase vitamin-B12 independent [Streptomyces sp. AA4]
MTIPSEPIGSIPRPPELLGALAARESGQLGDAAFASVLDRAVRETIETQASLGATVVTDGEQRKPSFVTYPIAGSGNLSADGVVIPFADGHQRQLPCLTSGPFRYQEHAEHYLRAARQVTNLPVKQAVIAPSALSLLYPAAGIDGYSRESFLDDLVDGAEADIRGCLDAGAHVVQLDFTEGRLSLKLDPSGQVLRDFVELNNRVLERFGEADRARLGVHTCPGGDQDSTHSLDVDYAGLLPELFRHAVGNFYVQLASESDPDRVLRVLADQLRPGVRVFVGVTDPIDPRVETAEEVRDRVLRAARYLPVEQLGTSDDCGFSPFADDQSTSRETAFAKMRARLEGTALAADQLGVGFPAARTGQDARRTAAVD